MRSTEQSAAVSGGIWTPGEPMQGFAVTMLVEPPQPVAVQDILPDPEQTEAMVVQRVEGWHNIRILEPHERPTPYERERYFDVPHAANPYTGSSDYDDMLRQSAVDVLARVYAFQNITADWHSLESVFTEDATLRQLVRFVFDQHEVYLYNVSNTQLDGTAIGKIANAMHGIIERVGCYTLGRSLDAMALVPIDHPTMYREVADGYRLYEGMVTEGTGVLLSEAVFDDAMPRPPHKKLPNPNSTTPFQPPGDWSQIAPFHELMHTVALMEHPTAGSAVYQYANAVGWWRGMREGWFHRSAPLPVRKGARPDPHPYQYGSRNPDEDVAVTASAEFAGGEAAAQLGPEYRLALAELYRKLYDGVPGRSFVQATELPLPSSSSSFGRSLLWPPLALRPQML